MGFLNHISKVFFQNKNNISAQKNSNLQSNLLAPSEKKLNRTNLNKDVFQSEKDVAQIALVPKLYTSSLISEPDFALSSTQEEYYKFIQKYVNIISLTRAINKNPNIERILNENSLDINLEINNVNSIIKSHLIPTALTVGAMYRQLGHSKNEKEYQILIQSALLHDIGKVFIPSQILNKKGKLTKSEREIVQLHNKLSYEILKTTDLDPKVAQLALEHHDYEENITRSTENQLLTIADCYCALREERPYKKPLNDVCAKAILYDMGTKGSFDTRLINYIK